MKTGFTLIELLVVVLIIGILATVALPQYRAAVEKARATQAISLVKTIGDAQEAYYLATGEYATNLDQLDIDVPGESCTFNGLPRKCTSYFDFGVSNASQTVIAISNRWPDNSVHDKAHYYLSRFPHDSSIYCKQGSLADPYKVCKHLSGGKTKADNAIYYIVQ